MSLWIAYNGYSADGVWLAALVDAEDSESARSQANGVFLERGGELFPGCWGQRRRFAIVEGVDPYDGPAPESTPLLIEVQV